MRAVRLVIVSVLMAVGATLLTSQASPGWTLAVGSVLTCTSLVLLVIARVQLGSSFAVLPQAKTLVTRGLYKRIPDPLYAFLDLALVGVIILVRQPWWLVLWAALVSAHIWASRREAVVLERAFGDAYRAYRSATWW